MKRIARRYKTQVDEQTKEMEELQKKVNESGQSTTETTAIAATPVENGNQASQETRIKELTEQVKNFEEEVKKLKKIARHYKTQVDEQTKEVEELKKKVSESGRPIPEGTATPATATAENVDLTSYETKVKELTEQVKNSEEEVKKLKELDEQNKVSIVTHFMDEYALTSKLKHQWAFLQQLVTWPIISKILAVGK